jgi:hypothetical protein
MLEQRYIFFCHTKFLRPPLATMPVEPGSHPNMFMSDPEMTKLVTMAEFQVKSAPSRHTYFTLCQ